MWKFLLGLFFFVYIAFYTYGYIFWSNSSKESDSLPLPLNQAVKLENVISSEHKEYKLPVAKPVKEVSEIVEKDDLRYKETPLTYSMDVKTTERLTREEIAEAPIVDIIPMRVNNQDMHLVLVQKNGKIYDASDGVRYFIPLDLDKIRKTTSRKGDFYYYWREH